MNKIQQLADIAKNSVPKGILTPDKWIEEYNKKFAELIVRECLGTLNHRYQWDGDVNDPQEIKKCIQRIQKHFGVEE